MATLVNRLRCDLLTHIVVRDNTTILSDGIVIHYLFYVCGLLSYSFTIFLNIMLYAIFHVWPMNRDIIWNSAVSGAPIAGLLRQLLQQIGRAGCLDAAVQEFRETLVTQHLTVITVRHVMFYLFMYQCLFKDIVSISDYIASNYRLIGECRIGKM
jgi:hypothetical protein